MTALRIRILIDMLTKNLIKFVSHCTEDSIKLNNFIQFIFFSLYSVAKSAKKRLINFLVCVNQSKNILSALTIWKKQFFCINLRQQTKISIYQ